jgi:hypothetical protein
MEDLSMTHHPNWKIKPTLSGGCAVAQGLAKLHAHYWGVEKLQVIGTFIPNQADIEQYIAHVQRFF